MAIELTFSLKLESDWHINAGYGQGAQIDSVIQRDVDGIPIITGSTLKGLFRDALYDLARNMYRDDNPNRLADDILGSPAAEGHWIFTTARPAALAQPTTLHAETGDDMAAVVTGVRVNPRTRRAENNKFYKREMGEAGEFTFTIQTNTDENRAAGDALWLAAAAAYIRHLGGRRRRGAGRCTIRLQEDQLHKKLLHNFAAVHCGQGEVVSVKLPGLAQTAYQPRPVANRRFRVWVCALRPVVISENPEAGNVFHGRSDIPGRTLRGAFAYRVPEDQRDSQPFRDLFVLGAAQFSNLSPVVYGPEINAAVIARTPMGVQQTGDESQPYRSVLREEPGKGKGYEKSHLFMDGYPEAEGLAAKQTYMHVNIDPQTKRATEGNLFAYEAPQSGSYYTGEITLNTGNWQTFAGLLGVNLETPFDLYIGKGRRRGYGHCRVWIEPLEDDVPPTALSLPISGRVSIRSDKTSIILTLMSDMILVDTWGRFVQAFEQKWLADALRLNEQEIRIEQQVVRTRLIQGFDMRAGLPQWRDIALVAGSSVKLSFPRGLTAAVVDELHKLELDGYGLRRAEGFGRVIVNHPAHSGIIIGFHPLIIPADLLSQDDQRVLRSRFAREWREQMEREITKQWDLGAALARSLVQHDGDYDTTRVLVENFGQSDEQGKEHGKPNRFESDQRKTLLGLLDRLNQQDRLHWRAGIVILAETLAKRSAEK